MTSFVEIVLKSTKHTFLVGKCQHQSQKFKLPKHDMTDQDEYLSQCREYSFTSYSDTSPYEVRECSLANAII